MMRTNQRLGTVAALAVASALVLALPGLAQVDIPPLRGGGGQPTPTPTRTASSTPTPTPSTPPPPPPPPGGGGGTTPRPSATSSATKAPRPPRDPGAGSSGRGGTSRPAPTRPGPSGTATTDADPFNDAVVVGPPSGGTPGFGLEGWSTREKSPPRTTTELLDLLKRIHGREPTVAELSKGFGRFPILGYSWYQDDYGAGRYIGRVSLHAGNDIFAPLGTPVTATTAGYIWKFARGGRGGNAIWLMGNDNIRYYYGHMDRFAFQPQLGRRLRMGEVFGYVGATGSAVGTPPHVHFEVNPGGRGTVNPKLHIDQWLDDAVAAARARLGIAAQTNLLVSREGGWSSLLGLLEDTASYQSPLWALGFDPTSTIGLADDVLDELLAGIAWDDFVSDPLAGASGPGADDHFRLGLDGFSHEHTD